MVVPGRENSKAWLFLTEKKQRRDISEGKEWAGVGPATSFGSLVRSADVLNLSEGLVDLYGYFEVWIGEAFLDLVENLFRRQTVVDG